MGRRLQTTVPILPSLLDPTLPDGEAVVQKENARKSKDAQCYDLRHRGQSLNRIAPRQNIWVTELKTNVAIIGHHTTLLSYLVEGRHGITITILSLCSLRQNRATVLQLNTFREVPWNDLQRNNWQQHHCSRMFQNRYLLLSLEPVWESSGKTNPIRLISSYKRTLISLFCDISY
ncbi:hypothetical protein ILYODFUR_036099 [Ilyodon furcidens]|uniref:Uncharacterized protein n=1 Tax=Ilyodon furcidens TaxID=33524 RepID=A0ABV0T3E6_9TELE